MLIKLQAYLLNKFFIIIALSLGQLYVFAQKPNVLLIVVDDLGWADIGVNGSRFYETPNIDRLAKMGVNFKNAYAANPVCSPTRASILTGKYPSKIGTTDWFGAPQPDQAAKDKNWKTKKLLPANYLSYLPLAETTIAEVLKSNGYHTMIAGKWHLGFGEQYEPEKQGFEINAGGIHKGHPSSYFSPYQNEKLTDGPTGEYLGDRLTQEAIKFIDNNLSHPFFLYFPMYEVHTPIQAKADLIKKYKEKKMQLGLRDTVILQGNTNARAIQCLPEYAAMVETMDAQVGKLMQHLEQNLILDNTLIIFTSDNGGLSTSEGKPTSNLPLRTGKGWLYEGGIRVPFILKEDKKNNKVSVAQNLVISNDIFPTILAACDINNKDTIDGINLLAEKNKNGVSRTLYWHYPHYGNQGGAPASAIREKNYKLIYWYETEKYELFDLQKDISEKNDLAIKKSALAKAMFEKLNIWLKTQDAKFPVKKNESGFEDSIYLKAVTVELQKKWPKNRPVYFVYHGHSVPAGYFKAPNVHTYESYPYLATRKIQKHFNTANISCINTAIGGENAVKGASRFASEVLSKKPDLVFIDYALNDRWTQIDTARMAWESMVLQCINNNIPVYLCTPTLDNRENILDDNAKLVPYVNMIKALAVKHNVGLIDSYSEFKSLALSGANLKDYVTEPHHPNEKGHQLVANLIAQIFGIK